MRKLLIYLTIISFVITGCSNNESEAQVLSNKIDNLNSSISVKDGKISSLKEQIKDNESIIDDLNTKIEELQEEITKLQEEIKYLQEKEQNNSEEKNYIPKYGITEDGRIFGISNKDYHPIIVATTGQVTGKFNGGTVLGGSIKGKWISLEDFVLPNRQNVYYLDEYNIDLVKGGEEFKMYSLNSYITTVTGNKPRYSSSSSNRTHNIETLFNQSFEAEGDATVGISGDWDALPRIPVPLEEVLGYSIDLDNDGLDEKVTIEPDPKDLGIVNFFLKKEGEDDVKFGTSYEVGDLIEWRELLFADLNEDGIIEMLIVEVGHNTKIVVYEYIEGKVKNVFTHFEGYEGD